MGIDLGRFRSNKNDEWLDWLADDPVPASLRAKMRAKAVQEASRPVVRRVGQPQASTEPQKKEKDDKTHSVSIHISVPKLKKPQIKQLRSKLPKELPYNLTYKKLGIGSAALIGVLVVGVISLNMHSKGNKPTEGKGVLAAHDQKANFTTLHPSDSTTNPSEQKYDAQKKVVSYTDSIGGVDITISQQQLPGGFQDNTDDKVKKLAQDFSANEVISTANPTAYLGTSIKGPQTVIFTKNGLLIFIQSTKKIDNHDWATYITSLK